MPPIHDAITPHHKTSTASPTPLTSLYTALQDTVSPPSNSRQVAAAVIISTAILILLPMLPGSETLGAGGGLNL